MKKIYLHIGTDKTGSTAIQTFLKDHLQFLEENGYSYIINSGWNHHALYNAAKQQNQSFLDGFYTNILNSNLNYHVISFEGFYHLDSEHIETFLEPFFDYEIRVILYIRNRIDKVCSGLAQRLKMLSPEDSLNFVKQTYYKSGFKNVSDQSELDYFAIIKKWESSIQKINKSNHIIVRPFEAKSFYKGELIEDFLSCLDICSKGDISLAQQSHMEKPINSSLSPAAQLIMFGVAALGVGSKSIKILVKRLKAADDSRYAKFSLLKDKQAKSLNKRFSSNDKLIAKTYLKRRKLFLEKPKFQEVSGNLEENFNSLVCNLLEQQYSEIPASFDNSSVEKLNELNKYVNSVRDAAKKLEKVDIQKAHDLMMVAHLLRPSGPNIKKKLDEYIEQIESSKN